MIKETYVKELGITDKDVRECTNREQLLEWKLQLEAQSIEVRSKIDAAKANVIKNRMYSDPDWFRRLNDKNRFVGGMLQLINVTLGELKRKTHVDKERNDDRLFVETAKQYLPKDVYEIIWKKALGVF